MITRKQIFVSLSIAIFAMALGVSFFAWPTTTQAGGCSVTANVPFAITKNGKVKIEASGAVNCSGDPEYRKLRVCLRHHRNTRPDNDVACTTQDGNWSSKTVNGVIGCEQNGESTYFTRIILDNRVSVSGSIKLTCQK